MKKKHEELVHIIRQQKQPISSTQLARLLNVTPRSVKNYVAAIQEEFPDLIAAGPRGYRIDTDTHVKAESDIPQTYHERSSYIIRQFFIDHAQEIDLYDLCDELYLSYSSIKGLLNRMNKEYQDTGITFRCRNDMIYADGEERHKRKFLTDIIYQESSERFVDLQTLKDIFPDLNVQQIHDILHETFKKHSCYINDFGYTNLTLHLAILLDRMQSGNTIEHSQKEQPELSEITVSVIDELEKSFHVALLDPERCDIHNLVTTSINLCHAESRQELITVVGQDIYEITQTVISSVNRQYGLQLDKDTLLYPLALHFKNLFARCKRNTSLRNPLLESIEASCPMLFDCAIYVANYLEASCNLHITADEIAYLAMHIGADIERQSSDSGKLKCVLLCPDYQNSRQEIYNYLLIHFDSEICISAACSYEAQLPDTAIDLLFTTIPVQKEYPHMLMIPPLKKAMNLKQIFEKIQEVMDQKKLHILSESFSDFFHESLFYLHTDAGLKKEQIIRILHDKLYAQGYTSPSFYEDVIKREEAASTAFGCIAVPHSMKMDARRTGIALALSKQGITWDKQIVHVVLLIAIHEQESHLFRKLYEALILLFSQKHVPDQIKECISFQEFRQLLLTLTD